MPHCLASLFRAASACVRTSARASRAPVAAASQGPQALIEDGKDGVLVPVDDAAALAAGVRQLLASPALRKQFATRGLGRVEAEFSETAVVAQWKALFADYEAI